MHPIRSATALLIAATAILTIAGSALAVDFDPTMVLRTAPSDVDLRVGDIAADQTGDGTIAVVWEETGPGGSHAYLRRSQDGGSSFEPRLALRGGRQAYDPQVATCNAGTYAVSTWPTASGVTRIGLDVLANPATPFGSGFSALPGAFGVGPDVTCTGMWHAVAWFDDSTSPAHVRLRVNYLTDVCGGECITQEDFDLGPGRIRHGLSVAMTEEMVHVVWKPDSRMLLQRIAIDWDGSVTATPRPIVTVLDSAAASRPFIAADGPDVALAYGYQGDTRARVSTNKGRTFGGPEILYEAPCTACEAGSLPMSIDLLDSFILVEAIAGGPGYVGSVRFLSDDGGDSWSETSTREGSRRVGALFHDDSDVFIAEAWDNTLSSHPGDPGPAHGKLRFHRGLLP